MAWLKTMQRVTPKQPEILSDLHSTLIGDWVNPDAEISLPQEGIHCASLGLKIRNVGELIQAIRRGFPVSSFEKLSNRIDMPAADLAKISNIALRTLMRRKKEGRFQMDESERLYRIGSVFDRALEILGEIGLARQWMKTPKKSLGGKTPIGFCDTEPGVREVEDLLGRIEHGVFS